MSLKITSVYACPICHATLSLQKNALFCKKCGRKYPIKNGVPILLSNLSSDVQLSEDRWDVLHNENKKTNSSTYSIKTAKTYVAFLEKYKKDYSSGYFLDLGCGIANASLQLAKEGVSVIGTDISYDALAKVR